LEQDIAITNISLDLIGQSRNFYQYAASFYNAFDEDEKAGVDFLMPRPWKKYGRELQEDDLAFLRDERQYLNFLITELPKGDWAQTVLRQFFFSAFQFYNFKALQNIADTQVAAIAEKSFKEIAYHLRWSSEWVIRLGDGTEESSRRIREALKELWAFTGEFFIPATFDWIDPSLIKADWSKKVEDVFQEARLEIPSVPWPQQGGKEGKHTEHLGYILTEMQYLQRTFPNSIW
jgi:ring-1,2-phenylacetyl-CoA epoxidase subunit PaaC